MRANFMASRASSQSYATDGTAFIEEQGVGFFNRPQLRHSLLILVLFSVFP